MRIGFLLFRYTSIIPSLFLMYLTVKIYDFNFNYVYKGNKTRRKEMQEIFYSWKIKVEKDGRKKSNLYFQLIITQQKKTQ